MDSVTCTTTDGVRIHGDFYPAEGTAAALLLHMMPATKESWRGFARLLVDRGIAALAIDERGHGESTKQEGRSTPLDYTTFSDAEQQAKIKDLEAAAAWLYEERDRTVSMIVGASIGANLALQYQVSHNDVGSSVLLSPGLNYRGIETRPLVRQLTDEQRVFIAGARGDVRSNGKTAAQMAEVIAAESTADTTELYISDEEAHGTDMFETDDGLAERIAEWLAT